MEPYSPLAFPERTISEFCKFKTILTYLTVKQEKCTSVAKSHYWWVSGLGMDASWLSEGKLKSDFEVIDLYTSMGTTLTSHEPNKQIPQSKFNKQNIKTRVIWCINVYVEMSINWQIRKRGRERPQSRA